MAILPFLFQISKFCGSLVNDLYAARFNPIMAGDDFNQFEDGGALPADVLDEQAKVERADCLALIYPIW